MDLRLEVIVLPVADVDRAKAFYERLRFRLDADFTGSDGLRVVQMTPPRSPCSIILPKRLWTAANTSGRSVESPTSVETSKKRR